MKAPVSWLRDYVEFDDSVGSLCDKLTFSGIEVEGIETVGGEYPGVVVGEVTAVGPHPNADRLRLCTVNTGAGEARVVCGAPNVEAGGKYPFAPVGTTLPNGMQLKRAKIRGEVSEGMLCAEDELGISEDHEGLMVLAPGLVPGTPLVEVLGPPETVLELEITPNRPDCLSLLGVAREIAALCGGALKRPDVSFPEAGEPVEALTRVEVADAGGCPRYTARVMRGVRIGPSPGWMQRRLQLAGVRAINNVVDITNYVMLETGHPLHAFDQHRLAEGRIVVRRAQPGEVMRTLDGEERRLDPEMVVIADAREAVAVAGIMGGAGSEIHDGTTTVLLESAQFDPARIRATSRRLGLSTESSYRFERGVDPETAEWASRRAAALFCAHANARIAPGVVDVYPAPAPRRAVTCRHQRVRDLTGMDVPDPEIEGIFRSLEMEVADAGDGACAVTVPSWRGDIRQEIDLVEEVARIYGLDKVPVSSPRSELVAGADDTPIRRTIQLRGRLVGLGLREIMNYSLLSPQLLDRFGLDAPTGRVVLPSPLSQDQSILRTSLIPQMVESLGRNANRQIREAAFFELGRTYHRGPDGALGETPRLTVGLLGPVGRSGIDRRRPVAPEEMFLAVKGVWEALAAAQQVADWQLVPGPSPALRDRFALEIRIGGRTAGRLGLLHRRIAREWRITEPVGVFEVTLEPLIAADTARVRVRPVPVFPAIVRDIALVVDETVRHQQVLEIVAAAAAKDLESVELFDIFRGEGIGAGRKSLAYSFTYRSAERTLTDEEANRLHEAVARALVDRLPAEVRA